MGMTGLCDPYGDFAKRNGGFLNHTIRSPNLIYLRFSVKQANGFFLKNFLTGLLSKWTGLLYIMDN